MKSIKVLGDMRLIRAASTGKLFIQFYKPATEQDVDLPALIAEALGGVNDDIDEVALGPVWLTIEEYTPEPEPVPGAPAGEAETLPPPDWLSDLAKKANNG